MRPNLRIVLGLVLAGTAALAQVTPQPGITRLTGDGTATGPGAAALTVSKTGGVLFGPFATGTDAGALTGTVSVNRFNSGTGASSSTFLRGDGTWVTPATGLGTVTSVALALPAIFNVSGSPVTGAGTLTGTLATEAANAIFAGPTTGAASAPTFRALVGADLPNPSSTTLGGVESVAPVTHNFVASISTSGVPALAQPACTDLSDAGAFCAGTDAASLTGTVASARISGSYTGITGVGTLAAGSIPAGLVTGLAASATTDTTNAANISSGTLPAGRLPNPSATTLGGVESLAAVTHDFLTSISTAGVPTQARPACADLSDSGAFCAGTDAASLTGTVASARISGSYTGVTGVGTLAAGSIPSTLITGLGYFATGTDAANLTGTVSVNRFDSGTGASSSTFLRGDGTWVTPTAGTGTVTTTGTPASGNLAKFSGATSIVNGDLSGDCTTAGTLAITCTKTNSVSFAASATTDTTNASNIGSGTLPAGRLPNPGASSLGGTQSFAAVTHQWIRQLSTSGVFTASQPACADISDATGFCSLSQTNGVTFAMIAQLTADQVLGNFTGSTANMAGATLPSCSAATSAVTYNTGTHAWGCNTISGTVSSVALSLPAIFTVSGSPVTTTGTLTGTLATEAKNLVFAGPSSGADAAPTFRALVGADLPNPSATTLGGIESIVAVSHNFLTAISTSGVPAQAQPACADLSDSGAFCSGTSAASLTGTVASGRISGSYTGITGVGTLAAGSIPSTLITGLGYFATGTDAANLTGTVPAGRLPNPSASTLGGVESLAAVSHNFLTSISTSGVPTQAQPAAADLSDGTSGSGAVVLASGASISLTAATGLPLSTGVTGQIKPANHTGSGGAYTQAFLGGI